MDLPSPADDNENNHIPSPKGVLHSLAWDVYGLLRNRGATVPEMREVLRFFGVLLDKHEAREKRPAKPATSERDA